MSRCTHDPKQTSPRQGAYTCPECGQMVMAGVVHLEYSQDTGEQFAPTDRINYDQSRRFVY